MSSGDDEALPPARERVAAMLHPVRVRLLQRLGGGPATTAELVEALGDVPASSVYRHLAVLRRVGAIEVAAERRVGGAIERTLRLGAGADVDPDDAAHMDVADHRAPFGAFLAGLTAQFDAYEQASGPGRGARGLGYVQVTVWLDDAERQHLLERLQEPLVAAMGHGPGPGRHPVTVALVVLPSEPEESPG